MASNMAGVFERLMGQAKGTVNQAFPGCIEVTDGLQFAIKNNSGELHLSNFFQFNWEAWLDAFIKLSPRTIVSYQSIHTEAKTRVRDKIPNAIVRPIKCSNGPMRHQVYTDVTALGDMQPTIEEAWLSAEVNMFGQTSDGFEFAFRIRNN